MIVYLSVLFALVGLLMYVLCEKPKLVEIGRLLLFAGVLAFLLTGAAPLVNLLHK